jgi:CubicO group peptidase (beta-lactamase class C family)
MCATVILSRPLTYAPGTLFNYDSYATHLLSIVLARATGRTLDRFAREALFDPLGIEHFEWTVDEEGHAFAGRGLSLTTHDMAKLGLIMLSGGEWQGERLLDEPYAHEAAMPHSAGGWPVDNASYGYLWWVEPHRYFATGFASSSSLSSPRKEWLRP